MTLESPIFQAATLLCLVPAIWYAWRGASDEGWSWPLAGLACVGPAVWAGGVLAEGWRSDFSTALWTTVAATLLIFVTIAGSSDSIRRLARLVFPYAGVLFLLATLSAPRGVQPHLEPDAWTFAHIVIAVLTYALITLAAVAGLAVFLKERALKAKTPNPVISHLPALADGEVLQDRFLIGGEVVLGLGVATGVAIQVQAGAPLLELDHKTFLTLGAFIVIGALLILRRTSGIRGRRAARYVMIAYLLVTLGYPGVKFVTGVLA
jgi:ABC-type uncharacterized transport system permease subunit